MALLQYSFEVVGAANVERAIASLERRFAAHNAKMNRMFGGSPSGTSAGSARASVGRAKNEATQILREQQRQTDYWHKARLAQARQRHQEELKGERHLQQEQARGIRLQEREQIRASRAQQREQVRLARAAQREAVRVASARQQFVTGTIGSGANRVLGGLASVGRTGAAMIGVGGAALAVSSIAQASRLDETTRRLSIAGRGKGEAGIDPKIIQSKITNTAIATGLDPEALASGVAAAVAKTGDLAGALENLNTVAIATQATGSDATDIYTLQADALKKFGLSAEDAKQALAMLNAQGKKGSFELKDLASQAPRAFAAAAGFGFKGMSGLRDVGGLLQVARDVTGGPEQAAFATEAMLRQMTAKSKKIQSGEAFGGRKVEVFEGGDPTKGARPFRELLGDTISASKGNAVQLQEVFGEEGIRLVRPFMTAFREASEKQGGGKAGDIAGREAVNKILSDAADVAGDWGEVQRDAADAMKATSVQLNILNNMFKKAVASQLFPEFQRLIPALGKLVPVAAELARKMLALVEYVSENPIRAVINALTLSVAAEMGRAKLGALVAEMLRRAFTSVPPPPGVPPLIPGGAPGAVPVATGVGGKLRAFGGTALRAGAFGFAGNIAGGLADDLTGGSRGATLGFGAIGTGAGVGAAIAGPIGALAGGIIGEVVHLGQELKNQIEAADRVYGIDANGQQFDIRTPENRNAAPPMPTREMSEFTTAAKAVTSELATMHGKLAQANGELEKMRGGGLNRDNAPSMIKNRIY